MRDLGGTVSIKIIVELFKSQAGAGDPLDELIGARADGILIKIVAALDQALRHDPVEVVSKVGQNICVRTRRGNLDRVGIQRLDLFPVSGVVHRGRNGLGIQQARHDIVRGELFAVMELNALFNGEDPLDLVLDPVIRGKIKLRLERCHVDARQAIVGQHIDADRDQRVVVTGGKGRRLAGEGDLQRILFRSALRVLGVVGVRLAAAADKPKGHYQSE